MNKEKIILDYSGASDIGMVRVENQDSIGKFPDDNLDIYSDKGQLFIVADGIGGHAGGKEASTTAVETIKNTYFSSAGNDTGALLRNAIESANSAIHQKAKTSEGHGRMGTTCTALILKNNKATIGQVGDSKVYRVENNKIEQLTMEHTQLNEMLREKILTEEEAKNYPSKSALSRALGMEEKVKVDIIEDINLKNGQIYILCTDGLAKVEKEEILDVVTKNSTSDSCTKLIGMANERGGKDNVTVQVIKIKTESTSRQPAPVKEEIINTERKKKSTWPVFVFIIAILVVIGFLFGNSFLNFFTAEKEEPIKALDNKGDKTDIVEQINPEETPLTKADQLMKNGSYEKALNIYQDILEKEPMNLSALEAVNNIADIYHDKADKLKSEKNFADALNLYLKIQKIQPDNIEIKNSILICENQVKFGEVNNENSGSSFQISGINNYDWSFINIDKNHYTIDDNQIKFLSTSFEKKSLINYNLSDAAVSVDLELLSNSAGKGAGIIFGSSENGERFYLLKFDGNSYILQLIQNKSVEELAVQKLADNNSEFRNIRIKCSGNLINLYDGMNLIYSWKSDEKIYGKAGIYADKNVQAEFKNIFIRGNKKSGEG